MPEPASTSKLTVSVILTRLSVLHPGDRVVFDTQPGYVGAPAPLNEGDRRTVCRKVDELVQAEKGMVFHRRVALPNGGSYIVREFVSVSPEVMARLREALARVKIPDLTYQYYT